MVDRTPLLVPLSELRQDSGLSSHSGLRNRRLTKASDYPLDERSQRPEAHAPLKQQNSGDDLLAFVDSAQCVYLFVLTVLVALVVLALREAALVKGTAYITAQILFLVVFALEIGVRMRAMGISAYFKDRQCVLDIVVTLLDFILVAIGHWSTVAFVFRLVRVFCLLKVFRTFHQRHQTELAPAMVINEDGSIIRYNPNKLFAWGFLTNLHGTVLASPEIYVQVLVLALLSTLYALNLCADECGHAFVSALPQVGTRDDCPTYCFSSIGPSNGLVFGSFVTFLLGLFNSLTFSRWWNMRDRLGAVIGRANDISLMYSAYVTGTDKESDWARAELIRYTNLAHAAVYKQACEDEDYSDLIRAGLCTEEEFEKLKPLPSRYMMIYSWLVELFLRTAESGRVAYPQTIVPLVHGDITVQRGAAADLFMYTGCQIPYIYVHLMTLIVKLHLVLVATVSGTFIGQGFEHSRWSDIAWGYMLLFTNTLVYQGLLVVHQMLVNPARRGHNHFPEAQYMDFVYSATNSVLNIRGSRLPFDAAKQLRPLKTHPLWRDSNATLRRAEYADEQQQQENKNTM